MKSLILLAAVTGLLAQTAQPPTVSNAKFETSAFSGDLSSTLRASAGAAWFGYAVRTMRGDHNNCCFDNGQQSGCSLEGGEYHYGRASNTAPVQLEGTDTVAVLFRVENNQVEKIRLFSLSCPLDAGGRRFVWLTGVPAEASLSYLENLARNSASSSVQDGAVFAISQHDTPRADDLLEQLTRSSEPVKVREKVAFWLGASRGARGVQILKNIVAHEENEEVRDKAVFALSISKQPEAIETLIETAKRDPSPHVRSQALFWLGHKAGTRAAATIQNAIENDPDAEVKKKAVFAMSQLPKDESVPKLIEIARTQRDPAVRKQAFFWLGQSNDPRALAFFEQVLAK
jgi:HEAT repeat protein